MSRIIPPATAFSLDPVRKGGRIEDAKHLAFIRTLRCLVSGHWGPCDAAHIRMGAPAHGKRRTPMGRKPDDCWVVPLNHRVHMDQHSMGEAEWWARQDVDPVPIAAALYENSGDREACLEILYAAWRKSKPLLARPPWARR